METSVDAKEFAKQLIADKCRALIESENMLPDKEMAIIKRAHKEYTEHPNADTFNNIKRLILQTKYVEESVEYKNFNRGTFLIAMNLIVNKCQDIFPNYKGFFATTTKRLQKIDPDMKSSPKDMLKHYYECIEEMENPHHSDDHYMVAYAKSIITKILYESVSDMTNLNGSKINIEPVDNKKRLSLSERVSLVKKDVGTGSSNMRSVNKDTNNNSSSVNGVNNSVNFVNIDNDNNNHTKVKPLFCFD
uniref:ORF52a n=1 Tax=Cydia pomonella granulosis virus TaxID=28289 RepID=A0A097P1X0_GVCP|nr:ORF52a [Cydia pomonella granulovirus]AIU36841.1 ORF52a [Cydia pomonella granulovirus]AIU36977.1 ORF52a [Cydia pomonella granulovirus]AIU37119.1 ORF52a [Cydia pomonella granulovirus]AIU37260.1 ORF52a [Cydia pomonella granulovirus]